MKFNKYIVCFCVILLSLSAFAACSKSSIESKVPNESVQTDPPEITSENISIDAESASDPSSDGLEYILNGESYSVVGIGSCTDTRIIIPATHNDLPVAAIDESAFRDNAAITEVIIPGSVSTIDNYAFENCTSLSKVVLETGLHCIGGAAFRGCTSLTEISIPESVHTVNYSAFACCTSLTNVSIGNNVKEIGSSAFTECTALCEVTIPNSVSVLGDCVFEGCSSLASIALSEGVENIGDMAFERCALTTLMIPSTVSKLGNNCFAGCTDLQAVYYNGTMDEWKAIKKGNMMYLECATSGAICTDGTTSY